MTSFSRILCQSWKVKFHKLKLLKFKTFCWTGHFSIMKKLWDLKKVLSYLELEGEGRGIIMKVKCPLLLGQFYLVKWPVNPNILAASVSFLASAPPSTTFSWKWSLFWGKLLSSKAAKESRPHKRLALPHFWCTGQCWKNKRTMMYCMCSIITQTVLVY